MKPGDEIGVLSYDEQGQPAYIKGSLIAILYDGTFAAIECPGAEFDIAMTEIVAWGDVAEDDRIEAQS